MNILLVEDDAGLVELITANLEELEFSVMSTTSGAEALAHLKKQTPDLILLDYSLPDINGKELINTLIKQQTTPPPFIITTGQGDERIAVDMMKLGAMDYLVKDKLFLEKLPDMVKRVVKEIESEGKLRHAEEALKESEERFRMISENAPILINSFDEDGRCLFWNRQCNKTFGWTIEEINEQEVPMALFYPDPAVCEEVIRTVTTDSDESFREWHPVTKDGKILSMMWANFSLPNGQVFSMGHDITKYKQVELLLQKQTHNLEERVKEQKCLYNISRIEVFDVSLDKLLQEIINLIPQGWQYSEITCSRITMEGKEYKSDNFKETIWKQCSDIIVYGIHVGILEVFYLQERPEMDEGPFLKEEINLIDAIAKRIRSFIENNQTADALRQSQKMESVGTLAGGVAHEFNNILGGITGYTEIAIDDTHEGSPVREGLDEILKLSNRAKDIVKQILSFSRKGKKEFKPIQPYLVIADSLKVLRATIPTTIEIKHNLDENSGTILADPTQINQVSTNLCMNAAHAMEDSGGVLEIGLSPVVLDAEDVKPYPDLETGEYVKLTVTDTGTGIDPKNIDKIFDPFFTTKRVGKGTGMGLSVTHGIIKDHGGVISVSSKLGEGSTFTVFLPRVESKSSETKIDDTIQTGTENILVVDDEEHIVFLTKTILERLGYKVTALTSSLEALNLFKKDPQRHDLIITDLTMPHLTGDRLASEIIAISPDIPVIIATGYADAIDSEKINKNGIKAFIPKPYQKQELAKTIRLILDEK